MGETLALLSALTWSIAVLLFKASRGVRLERVHAAVKQELLERRRARALRAARRRESAKT